MNVRKLQERILHSKSGWALESSAQRGSSVTVPGQGHGLGDEVLDHSLDFMTSKVFSNLVNPVIV